MPDRAALPKELRFAAIYALFIYYPLIFSTRRTLFVVMELMSGGKGAGWGCNPLYGCVFMTISVMYGLRVHSFSHVPKAVLWIFVISLPLVVYAVMTHINNLFDIYTLADISTALAPALIAAVGSSAGMAAAKLLDKTKK